MKFCGGGGGESVLVENTAGSGMTCFGGNNGNRVLVEKGNELGVKVNSREVKSKIVNQVYKAQ